MLSVSDQIGVMALPNCYVVPLLSTEYNRFLPRVMADWVVGTNHTEELKGSFIDDKRNTTAQIEIDSSKKERVSQLLTTASGKRVTISEEAAKRSKRYEYLLSRAM